MKVYNIIIIKVKENLIKFLIKFWRLISMKKINYNESDFSLEDLEKINECREWVDDYIDLNARKAVSANQRRTVFYWKKVFEETLPSFLLEDIHQRNSCFGLLSGQY